MKTLVEKVLTIGLVLIALVIGQAAKSVTASVQINLELENPDIAMVAGNHLASGN